MQSRRAFTELLRVLIAAALVWAAWVAVTQATAEWYFRRGTLQGFRQALRWNPNNPKYHAALARALELSLEGDPREILSRLETATRLGPHRAEIWAQLGEAHEGLGNGAAAGAAYRTAHQLFPNSPEINWKLGNYHLRAGRLKDALRFFRTALTGDPGLALPVFHLAWRAVEDNQLILAELVPAEPGSLLAYLNYLADAQRMDAAHQTWERLLALPASFHPQATFRYLDALIRHRRHDELAAAWAALTERSPRELPRPDEENQVVNGSFESAISNGGLDWRVQSAQGVTVRMDRHLFYDGTHSLRIDFDGSQNLRYSHLFQYVPVRPGKSYQFAGYLRTQGITTDQGPHFQLTDADDASRFSVETDRAVATAGWSPFSIRFRVPEETYLLLIRVARQSSEKLDNRLTGAVWVDHVRLVASPDRQESNLPPKP